MAIILMDPEATSQRSSLRLYPDSDFMDCVVTAWQMEGQAGAAGPQTPHRLKFPDNVVGGSFQLPFWVARKRKENA